MILLNVVLNSLILPKFKLLAFALLDQLHPVDVIGSPLVVVLAVEVTLKCLVSLLKTVSHSIFENHLLGSFNGPLLVLRLGELLQFSISLVLMVGHCLVVVSVVL